MTLPSTRSGSSGKEQVWENIEKFCFGHARFPSGDMVEAVWSLGEWSGLQTYI